jgi:hypothetical protein
MQIKKMLFINVAFLACAGLIVVLVTLLILDRVNRAEAQSELVNEIAISAFERSVFRSDYLRTGNEI